MQRNLGPEGQQHPEHTGVAPLDEMKKSATEQPPPWPFKNFTTWNIMRWMNTGSTNKSEGEVNRLVEEVLNAESFNIEELRGFDTHRENVRLDLAEEPASSRFHGFLESSVMITVPTGSKDTPSKEFTVPGLMHRDILTIIKEAFQGPLASKFHFSPFRIFHNPADTNIHEKVHGELYTSNSFIREHDFVQRAPLPPNEPSCSRERVVAALMWWSDSTHLANFGTASLWPIYLFFGNLSKYVRAQPASGACHHVAYIPSVG